MDDMFEKDEMEIERLSNIVKSMKYTRLCFIDLIDQGAIFTRDKNFVKIELECIKPTDYKLLSEYYSKLSITYDSIIESIDKIKLEFKPISEVVTQTDDKITIKIEVYSEPKKETTRSNEDDRHRHELEYLRYKDKYDKYYISYDDNKYFIDRDHQV